MPLKPGSVYSPQEYANSMAQAIEEAFKQEFLRVKGTEAPETAIEMKIMFCAIAKGVVTHLQAHANDFKVRVNNGSIDVSGVVTQID